MRPTLKFGLLTTALVLIAADTVSAGPFGRIWERRKAELQGELSAQLNYEVSAASQDLAARLDHQLATEATELEAQMDAQLAALREEAMSFLAKQSAEIQAQVAGEVAKLKEEAQVAVTAEANRLNAAVEQQLDRLHRDANRQLNSAVTDFQTKADDHIKLATQNAQTVVEAELARLRAEAEAARQAQAPASPAEPEKPEEQGIQTTPVQLKEDAETPIE